MKQRLWVACRSRPNGDLAQAACEVEKIFTTPAHKQTEDYITGRFG